MRRLLRLESREWVGRVVKPYSEIIQPPLLPETGDIDEWKTEGAWEQHQRLVEQLVDEDEVEIPVQPRDEIPGLIVIIKPKILALRIEANGTLLFFPVVQRD